MSELIEYEYPSPTDLEGDAAIFLKVPEDIFWTNDANDHLIAIFAYFSVKRGLDNTVTFSVNNIVNWLGKLPNRNKYGINRKVMDCLKYLEQQGYLQISDPLDHASLNEATFYPEKVKENCYGKHFLLLYWDELKKILHFPKRKYEKAHLGYETVLIVYLYLKWGTFKRPNKLRLQETTNNVQKDVEARRKASPEAFDAYYYEMAEDLGLSSRAVSAAVKILSELEMVYFEELPKYKNGDEWRTDHTIFAFMYKRELGKLLASGKEYYELEVENKKKKLNRYRRKGVS